MNDDRYENGLAMRRSVLGDSYVDASLAAATDFSRDMQTFVTQYCWNDVWTRPGLTPAQRSMLNIAMLTALNRGVEFKAHVRGALNNGVTRDEIKEILLQAAVYCGAPAALESFRLAGEVFTDRDAT